MRVLSAVAAISIAILLVLSCGSRTDRAGKEAVSVHIDLDTVAPIGYEICADRTPKLSHANLDLALQMPEKIEIPAGELEMSAKNIEFTPGRHEIDVYRNLNSGRLLRTGTLTTEGGVPTIRARLEAGKLPKG